MPWDIGPVEVDPTPDHNSLLPNSATVGPSLPDSMAPVPTLEQHLSNAHAQTGWNQVHSQFGITGKGQTVAVIDSGIAFDHVALGKGFGSAYRVVGGWDFAENDARPYDDAPAGFHGTHVAGIIGANDGVHFGVAPNVDLVALRVFNDTGKGEIAWAENALRWVHDNRNQFEFPITTVNLSLGAAWNSSSVPAWATLEEELSQLQRDGIVVVVSAGNSFQQNQTPGLSYPAASPFVIPVASVDPNGALSDFSQRDSRVIAAPGRGIESTVPDYFYGKDGIHNDWAKANGTSMAAPYISGASILVREAMEMAGISAITPQSIYEHLKTTANSVWDPITQSSYFSLDLDRAIESLIPRDTVGDTWATGQQLSMQSTWQTSGWLNSLDDEDVYKVQPTQSGTLSLQVVSDYLEDTEMALIRGGQESTLALQNGRVSMPVVAGEAIGFSVSDLESIGPYRLQWSFVASSPQGGDITPAVPQKIVDLGNVDVLDQALAGDSRYRVTAEHTGLLSIVVEASNQSQGTLQVLRPGTTQAAFADSTLENNQWRLDVQVNQGQSIEFALPTNQQLNVKLVNLLEQKGDQWTIHGTDGPDKVELDLSQGMRANVAGVNYVLTANGVGSVFAQGNLNNDSLTILGSNGAEKIELRPGDTSMTHEKWTVAAKDFESVRFVGNGGPDRAYLYDALTDDRLSIWPNKAELTGVGYAFQVEQAERIFVHALQGGDDQAFVFDSASDDSLSVRPQFTSLSGQGYFNYVSGFERVFAYASAGGVDRAMLYDSAADDLLSSSGDVTSIVGPGFSTFARNFENVEAFASAGGTDRATIFAPSGGSLLAGPGFVGMQGSQRLSIARDFERVESFPAVASFSTSTLVEREWHESNGIGTSFDAMASAPSTDSPAAPLDAPSINSSPYRNGAFDIASSDVNGNEPDLKHASPMTHEWIRLESVHPRISPATETSPFDRCAANTDESMDLTWLEPMNDRLLMDRAFADLG
jgi:hypothetical protein